MLGFIFLSLSPSNLIWNYVPSMKSKEFFNKYGVIRSNEEGKKNKPNKQKLFILNLLQI